jgi:hypothetical protein
MSDMTPEERAEYEAKIARAMNAPLSVCPYGARFADDDEDHPCFVDCQGECDDF